MPTPRICIVAAVAADGGIGRDGELLAKLPGDLPRLKAMTLGSPVVMGRKTWDSIGRPLPGRRNVVLTRDRDWLAEGAERAASLDEAIAMNASAATLFILGGAAVYAAALPLADTLELTEIDATFPADTWFPTWNRDDFVQTTREERERDDGLRYAYVHYERRGSDHDDV